MTDDPKTITIYCHVFTGFFIKDFREEDWSFLSDRDGELIEERVVSVPAGFKKGNRGEGCPQELFDSKNDLCELGGSRERPVVYGPNGAVPLVAVEEEKPTKRVRPR